MIDCNSKSFNDDIAIISRRSAVPKKAINDKINSTSNSMYDIYFKNVDAVSSTFFVRIFITEINNFVSFVKWTIFLIQLKAFNLLLIRNTIFKFYI